MKTIIICVNCDTEINFSQEEIEKLFNQCNDCYILKENLLETPKCPHCHTNFDEMTRSCFKTVN